MFLGTLAFASSTSDETAADSPLDFRPSYRGGRQMPPNDVYSIVIGGNRLSRGLTIEGLSVSYYTRASAKFAEDTTVQRERWFGYRGKHLEFCRLFTHRELALRLTRFHEHDEDLRLQLAWRLANGREPTDATLRFLRLRDSQPTSKLGRGQVGALEIAGARLFFDRVQMGQTELELAAAKWNQDRALDIADSLIRDGEPLLDSRGKPYGYLAAQMPAVHIADCLDAFRYTFHNPDPETGSAINVREWHRPPCKEIPESRPGLDPSHDPFLLAAYLRFWESAYQASTADPTSNRFRARDTVSRWIPCPPPYFNLVLRCGRLEPADNSPFRHPLVERAVSGDGRLGSRWRGRGRDRPGDEWIDLAPPSGDRAAPRGVGLPGLALLHVISRSAVGRSGLGEPYQFDRPAFGLVVPEGGPCVEFVLAAPEG